MRRQEQGATETRNPEGNTVLQNLRTRPLIDSDIDTVRVLRIRSFTELAAHRYSAAQIRAFAESASSEDYAATLIGGHMVVACRPDGRIIGTAGWTTDDATHEGAETRIRKVFVCPDHARRGLATTLVRDREEDARRAGFTRLCVRASLNAVSLYERLGYRIRREDVMSTPSGVLLPCLFMEKRPEQA